MVEMELMPDHIKVEIKSIDDRTVATYIDDKKVGDNLTDCNYVEDGYRYHDIFHIAYATHLDWSPTLRNLMNLNRGDEHPQDSPRARLVEEGISAMIFAHAERTNYLEGIHWVNPDIIRMARLMSEGWEVSTRGHKQWQKAILEGYRVFRHAFRNGKVSFTADFSLKQMNIHDSHD